MATPNPASLVNPEFRKAMLDAIDKAAPMGLSTLDLLPRPPRFRKSREISARRASKLRKRGEYCHFVRWTVNGKCRYTWSGPVPDTFTFRFPRTSGAKP